MFERLENRQLMTASQAFVEVPDSESFLFGTPCPGDVSEFGSMGDYTGDGIDDLVAFAHHCSDGSTVDSVDVYVFDFAAGAEVDGVLSRPTLETSIVLPFATDAGGSVEAFPAGPKNGRYTLGSIRTAQDDQGGPDTTLVERIESSGLNDDVFSVNLDETVERWTDDFVDFNGDGIEDRATYRDPGNGTAIIEIIFGKGESEETFFINYSTTSHRGLPMVVQGMIDVKFPEGVITASDLEFTPGDSDPIPLSGPDCFNASLAMEMENLTLTVGDVPGNSGVCSWSIDGDALNPRLLSLTVDENGDPLAIIDYRTFEGDGDANDLASLSLDSFASSTSSSMQTLQVGSAGFGLNQNQWPDDESPDKIIDGVGQKYLNFVGDEEGHAAGVLIDPNGADSDAIPASITFWTANDEEARDPASFEVYGSNQPLPKAIDAFVAGDELSLGLFTKIAAGELSLPSTRSPGGNATLPQSNSQTVEFSNSESYDNYLVLFPSLKDAASDVAMQLAEVQLNHSGPNGIFSPDDDVVGVALLPEPECVPHEGDFNGDGEVNFSDFLTLSRGFGKAGDGSQGDTNCDGQVNFSDFLTMSRNFGKSVG